MSNPAAIPIIEMSGVTVGAMRDPAVTMVSGVNWTVVAGDFWAVAGLGRSGKSDLLMLAAGLMAARGGSYRLFGEEMPIFEEARLATRLRLGFVFDGGQLFNNLTVAENIALPMRYHDKLPAEEILERVSRLLELTELMPFANSTPGTMGRNWQKRAGLARALALQPEILLLDNPLGGVDVREAGWWLSFLSQLSAGHEFMPGARATTLVVSADDLRPWRDRANQFAMLRDGQFENLGGRTQLGDTTLAQVKELLAESGPKG